MDYRINLKSYLNTTVTVKIDRRLGSKHPEHNFVYPVLFVYSKYYKWGRRRDCYILGEFQPLQTFTGKCIAIIHRLTDNNDKLIVSG